MSVFQNFDIENDIKTGQISIVSSGMWSGGVGTLNNFFTSSTQTGSTGEHYFDVFNGEVGTDATASVQFSIAFGNFHGSGSLSGDNDNAASKAIYRQLRNLLLPQGTEKFQAGAYQGGGTDADTDGFVDGISVAINATGFKGFFPCNGVLGMSGGATTAATETADEVEVVISGTAGAGGVIALKFFGIASDSPTA